MLPKVSVLCKVRAQVSELSYALVMLIVSVGVVKVNLHYHVLEINNDLLVEIIVDRNCINLEFIFPQHPKYSKVEQRGEVIKLVVCINFTSIVSFVVGDLVPIISTTCRI